MYVVLVEHEGLLSRFFYENIENAIKDIKKLENEEYGNNIICYVGDNNVGNNVIIGKYDTYYIVKLEKGDE